MDDSGGRTSSFERRRSQWRALEPAAAAAVAGAAIWLATRQYGGIHNDATLYTLMALAWRDPGVFASDLFVRYGSQDPFSIFSPIYGALIGPLGIAGANMALLLAAFVVWLVGAWMLTHRLLRGTPAHSAFVLLTAIGAAYGGWGVLYAGENVLTPRPLAEGLVMIGLALLLGRRRAMAAAALALAALFHPAMALAGLGAALVVLGLHWRRIWWAVPLGAVAALALAAAHVEPFGRLFLVMDGPWLAGVRAHNGFVFPSVWMAADWVRVASQLALCSAAALWSGGDRRRVFIAVQATAVAGLIVSMIGADLVHDALIVQLQTWRLDWLLAVVALPAALVAALRLRRRRLGPAASTLLAAPLLILVRPFSDQTWAWAAALAMSLAGLTLAWLIRRGRAPALSRTANRMIIEAAAILPIGAAADSLINFVEDLLFYGRHHVFSLDPMGFIGVREALLTAGVGVVLLARLRPAAALATAVLAFVVAAMLWDARTPWDRYVAGGAASPLALPMHATILWGDDATPTWFLLRRPAYVSFTQGAGLLFSRATSEEWRRRAAIVGPLSRIGEWSLKSGPPSCAERAAPVARATIDEVCQAAAGGLAGVVVDRPVVGAVTAAFATPVADPYYCRGNHGPEIHRVSRFSYVACAGPTAGDR